MQEMNRGSPDPACSLLFSNRGVRYFNVLGPDPFCLARIARRVRAKGRGLRQHHGGFHPPYGLFGQCGMVEEAAVMSGAVVRHAAEVVAEAAVEALDHAIGFAAERGE